MRSRPAALCLAVVLAAGACGAQEDAPGPDGRGDADASSARTSLRIEVLPTTEADSTVMTLECEPTGGDHPNAEAACEALASAGPEVLEPVPQDRACTMVYGGPEVASVSGTLEGEEVQAAFSRSDGCEIERWDALGTEFFDVPLQ